MAAVDVNPDDTEAAIRAIAAMSGGSQERCFRRFKRSTSGARMLRERPELYNDLDDIEYLGSLPEGSLGKAIWEFYTSENLSAEGLKAASEAARDDKPADTDLEWFGRRQRDLHDVFHVLTGYGRDLRGEVACLAFTFAQTWNTGLGYLVYRAVRDAGWNSELGKLTRQAFRRGRRSQWLLDQDWQYLFEQPLDSIRDRFGIGDAPTYEQVRSEGAPLLH
jgi:ubiquinone biosynthesis protein COQ4